MREMELLSALHFKQDPSQSQILMSNVLSCVYVSAAVHCQQRSRPCAESKQYLY